MILSKRNLTIAFIACSILSIVGYAIYRQNKISIYPLIEIRNVAVNGNSFQDISGGGKRAEINEGDQGVLSFDVFYKTSAGNEEPIYPNEETDISVSILDENGYVISTSKVDFLAGGMTTLKARFMAPFAGRIA